MADIKPYVVATYNYTDESGATLFQCLRFQPKDFRQRRPDGMGGWVYNLDGVRRVPYRLHLLVGNPSTVYIVEGEKDVHTAESLGLLATCCPLGAGKWLDSYSAHLRGRRVVIVPDNDAAGLAHGDQVLGSLIRCGAASLKLVRLPVQAKGDLTDWVIARPASAARGELIELVTGAAEYVRR